MSEFIVRADSIEAADTICVIWHQFLTLRKKIEIMNIVVNYDYIISCQVGVCVFVFMCLCIVYISF